MSARCLRFFLRHAAVIVRIETIEHASAHGRELGTRERAVAVRVRVRTIRTLGAALTTLAPLRALRTFRRLDHAVMVRIDAVEHRCWPREEFLARDVAVIVRVGAFKAAMATAAAPRRATLDRRARRAFLRA